jgi:molybdopterin-guanine dinucleotide biosynthesis protein A
MIKKNITGIVLAGGKSSRMGTDKGVMELNGKKVIQYVLDALVPIVDDILIIANNDHYDNFAYPVYKDIIKDCGPMGGIYTGLINSTTMKNIVVSCDIPFITSPMLLHIISESGNYEITVPKHDGRLEPLCAVYTKQCTGKFKELLEKKVWKMQEALNYFKTQQLNISDTKEMARNFININTPEELKDQTGAQ